MKAIIHTLHDTDTIDDMHKLGGDNQYAARYNGEWYSAINNAFNGMFYVDNIYGKMPPAASEALERGYQARTNSNNQFPEEDDEEDEI